MLFKDVGYLCTEREEVDKFNKPYKTYQKVLVFCNSKGVKRNEFYQAQAQGYRPELCVEIKEIDYAKQTHFEFGGTMYRIIRTYPVDNECLEIIAQSLVSDA
ncbi:MAG: hypothetical protein IJI83_03915 [Oscillospiraceae bacterium]|nr:hypothetical protein [Oscillospiraceae bacterium]